MSGDHVERLGAWLDAHGVIAGDPLETDLRALVAEVKQLRTEHIPLMTLRQAWRNGWVDRANAFRQAVADSNGERDAYERAFVRYMSENPAEDDKNPYRPVDGPDDPAFEQQYDQDVTTCGFPACGHPDHQSKRDGAK